MSLQEIKDKITDIISKLASKVNENPDLINAIAVIAQLRKSLQDVDVEFVRTSLLEGEKIRKIEAILSLLESRMKMRAPTYIDDYIALFPELSYPLKIPSKLFESEKVKKVTVVAPRPGKRPITDEVSVDEMMTLLFPGLLTFRYGRLHKVPVGRWSPFSYKVTPTGVAIRASEKNMFEIKVSQLPPDYPAINKIQKVFIPEQVNLKDVTEYVRREEEIQEVDDLEAESTLYVEFCTKCGAIHDGDETCNCGRKYLQYAAPPKSYPLIWNIVEITDKKDVAEDPLFRWIFEKISFSTNTTVYKILYGFERRFKGLSWRVFYDTLYGDSFTTDGIIFVVSEEIIKKIYEKIKNENPLLVRDLRLLQYIWALYDVVNKEYGYTFWQTLTIVKAILLSYFLQHQSVPKSMDEIDEAFSSIIAKSDILCTSMEQLTKISEVTLPLTKEDLNHLVKVIVKEVVNKVNTDNATFSFIKDILTHSIGHYVLISAMILLGADHKDLHSHYPRGSREIYLYDNLPDGNGYCETLSKLMKIPLEKRIKALRQAIEKDVPITVPSKDFYSILEELMSGCKAQRADLIYLKLLRDPKTVKLIEVSATNDKLRQELLEKLRKSFSLDDYSISHIDALLRYPSHYKVLKHVHEDELFIFRIVPEMLVIKLKETEKKEISPESASENLNKDVIARIQDALEMCLDGCPMCLYISFCEMGPFLAKYMLSRRLVEVTYKTVREQFLIDIARVHPQDIVDKALKMLESSGLVYLRASSSEFLNLLQVAYCVHGQPVGKLKAYIKSVSFDWTEGFIIKMEAN
jgi:hypothetical protein